MPSMSGQAEVEDDDVGVRGAPRASARSSPVVASVDLVAARLAGWCRAPAGAAARRRRRAPCRVIDRDARQLDDDHRRCRRPGVSSISSSPPIASTNPRATARPRPTPRAVRAVAEPLERLEHPLAIGGRDARAAVDDAQRRRDRRPRPAVDADGRVAAATSAARSSTTLATTRSSSAGSARTRGSVSGTSTSTPSARVAEARERRPARPRRGRPRRSAAASAPACSRLMSSRLPTSALSRSVSSSIVSRNSRALRRRPLDVVLAAGSCRRLDRRERRAQVVRHRLQQRGAQLVGLGQRRRRARPRPAARAARERDGELRGERVSTCRSSPVRPAADEREHDAVAERRRESASVGRARHGRDPADASSVQPPLVAARARATPSSRTTTQRARRARRAGRRRRRARPRAGRASPPRRAPRAASTARRAASVDERARRRRRRRGTRTARARSRPRRS